MLWGGVALAGITAALLSFRPSPDPALPPVSWPVIESSGSGPLSRAETRDPTHSPSGAEEERWSHGSPSALPHITLPVGITQVLRGQPERLDRLEAAFRQWHKTHPELAAKLVAVLAGRLGVAAVAGDESLWSHAELVEAMALVLELEVPEDRLPLLSELATHLASVDPAGALGFLDTFPNSAAKEQFLGEVLEGWTRSDPAGAAQWARAEPSGALRESMLDRIVQNLVQKQPAEAAALVAVDFESPQAQANAARTVVGRWAQTDPPAVGTWLSRFPDDQLRSEMLHVLIASWRSRNEAAAAAWIEALPAGPFRRQVEGLAARLRDAAVPPHISSAR